MPEIERTPVVPVWGLIAAVCIGGLFYVYGQEEGNDDMNPPTISVTGEGRVSAAPDIAELNFGVQVQAQRTAQAAMEQLAESMESIIAAVEAEGVEERDIRTQQFSLSPQYNWNDGEQTLRGYQANQTLRVKVRDLEKISTILGAATAAGANQAGNVQFTTDDPDDLLAQARDEAIAEAKAKAEKLADQLGVDLGDIRGFYESQGGYQPPMPMMMRAEDSAMGGGAEFATPLPAGENETVVQVTITYELD